MSGIPVGSKVVFTGNWNKFQSDANIADARKYKEGIVIDNDESRLPYYVSFGNGDNCGWFYHGEIALKKDKDKEMKSQAKKLSEYLNTPGFYYCVFGDTVIMVTNKTYAVFITGINRHELVDEPDDWNVIPVVVKSLNVEFTEAKEIEV